MSVSVGDSSHLEQLLHRGRIDVAFIQRPENTESFEPIDFPPIGLKALVPSAPLPGAPAGTHRLEESGHQPLALMRRVEGSGTFEAILGQLRRAGIHPNVKLDVSDPAVAVEFNRTAAIPGELVGTDVEVDPDAELSGVYRHVGAGGACLRPTRKGPAMLFNKVKGFENFRVAIGLLSTRQRAGRLLDCAPERLGFLLKDSVRNPIPPVVVGPEKAQCREIVHLASDPDSDLRTLLPAPTNTPEDAGPYITMGMCHASDPETGESDITIHRLCE